MFGFFSDLDQIKDILDKATVLLCKFLDPSNIVITLKSKQHLKRINQQEISHLPEMQKRVETLLTILRRKEKEAYFAFMAALRKERPDLFAEVINMECTYTLGMEFDISFLLQCFTPRVNYNVSVLQIIICD